MPVLQVFAGPLPEVRAKLDAACRAVADALGLQPGDVVATYVPVAETVVPGAGASSWPIVVVHGSARPPDQMALARERLEALAAGWTTDGNGGAWVTWALP